MQLIAEQLVVVRGSRAIINDLSFAVQGGEVLVLTGPNGVGKTTLLRALAGFLRVQSGALRLEGGDPEKTLGEQAHVVGHANGLKGALTVRENITFWANYLAPANAPPAQIEQALDHFALQNLADFPTRYLSAGQQRRVGLARILAATRPIWLLDEPTASLDAASSALLAAAIDGHTRTGGLAIAATHLPLALDRARALSLATQGGAP